MRVTCRTECNRLRRELLGVLDKFVKLTPAVEAFRGGEDSIFGRLEDAVEIALREKLRAYGELRQQREGHG